MTAATPEAMAAAALAQAQALTPAERLALSRARLRKVWIGNQAGPGTSEPHANKNSAGSPGVSSTLDLVLDTVSRWWAKHPLNTSVHVVASLAEPAARHALTPHAQAHPLKLVALAAAGGAALIWLRPWQWLPRAALSSALIASVWPAGGLNRWLATGGLVSVLGSDVLKQWLAGLATASSAPQDPADPATAAGTETAATAGLDAAADPDETASYTGPRHAPMGATRGAF